MFARAIAIRKNAFLLGQFLLFVLAPLLHASAPPPPHDGGPAAAVYALLERVLPGASARFALSLAPSCPGLPPGAACFALADASGPGGAPQTAVSGTSASELAAGVGFYLRELCGMTIGWPRGGGSSVAVPAEWPSVGAAGVARARSVPLSHVTQVCTHSYTLAWHGWPAWERFIDWMALAGHNSIVAPTGQEEVQWRVLSALGVADLDIRNWTNGPAFLTWSRGQNGHGNGIAGPLPRSFMQSQWALQRQILARYRELGIKGHLPGFQGNAPWALAVAQNDTANATRAGDTAWVDGRDPLFTRIADAWAAAVAADFGLDDGGSVWQMDAFFGNGTSWGDASPPSGASSAGSDDLQYNRALTAPACVWSPPIAKSYLAGCPNGPSPCPSFPLLAAAQEACASLAFGTNCGGVTVRASGLVELRAATAPKPSPDDETSFLIENALQCRVLPPDPVWAARGRAAFGSVQRVDQNASWVYQGWALKVANTGLTPPSPEALARLRGLASGAPPGLFVILDMETNGAGQWREWAGAWGLPFIWTSLHTFGGSISIKGNLSLVADIPFAAPPLAPAPAGADPRTQVVGVGYTPEGLDQNPAYYELIQEAAFSPAPVANLTAWLVRRGHRRYGLLGQQPNADVAAAWAALSESFYAMDAPVSDGTGVGILPATDLSHWAADLRTPTPALCRLWAAGASLLAAAPAVASPPPEPFVYDLVNTAREALAQLTVPVSVNFSRALRRAELDTAELSATGALYAALLRDLDALLATDSAFLLGPWLAEARALGGGAADCVGTLVGNFSTCDDFMEWNARVQITTWYPTPPDAVSPGQSGGRDGDYARKQWSGLIASYYAPRADAYLAQALFDAAAGQPFNITAMQRWLGGFSFAWQTSTAPFPLAPQGDPVAVTAAMRTKYAGYFGACGA